MTDRRMKNAEIFRDTERRYTSDPALIEAVRKSTEAQIFISEKDTVSIPAPIKAEKAKVTVSGKRSLEAAEPYAKQGKKVCVLNFASATNPGGGVVNGSSAQEESLCRCSTLYPCLNTKQMWDIFYGPHRQAGNPLYNDDCIYTPEVCVFKGDTNFPEPLWKKDWWKVNILTCAAPNLRARPSNAMNPYAGDQAAKITPSELEKLLTARIRRIFEIAVAGGNEVLILGAFGCGAFKNPPEIVSKVFQTVMQDYVRYFDVIEYAVFHTERETANYTEFLKNISVDSARKRVAGVYRPYIVCHMTGSVDGKVTGSFLRCPESEAASEVYYEINRAYQREGSGSFICGRITMEESFTGGYYPDLSSYRPVEKCLGHYMNCWFDEDVKDADYFAIAFDPKGKLGWRSNVIEDADPGYGGAKIIEVLTEQADPRYLAYLQEKKISYFFAGETEIDVPLALRILCDHLSPSFYVLEGGSIINGHFLRADCVDEISLVQSPVTGGDDGKPLFADGTLRRFELISAENRGGVLVTRYTARKEG